MIFMSRSDFIFFDALGHRYKDKAEEFEQAKNFVCAATNYTVAGECFGKADEIARSDMMIDHGETRAKKEYCERKTKEMQEKSREQQSSVARHSSK